MTTPKRDPEFPQAEDAQDKKATSVEFETRARKCGYYEAPLPQKLEYILTVKHFSLEEGADANFELFHNLIPEVVRVLTESESIAQRRVEEAFDALDSHLAKEYLSYIEAGQTKSAHFFKLFRRALRIYRETDADSARASQAASEKEVK